MYTLDTLKSRTLDEVHQYLREGRISRELAQEWVDLWNTYEHRLSDAVLTQAGNIVLTPRADDKWVR